MLISQHVGLGSGFGGRGVGLAPLVKLLARIPGCSLARRTARHWESVGSGATGCFLPETDKA